MTVCEIKSCFSPQRVDLDLGRDLFTGLPMNLETFTQDLANANIAIFGVPGSGKSVTVKTIIGRTALINRRSSILDIEGEYVAQTEKLGGRIIKVRQTIPVGINLFDIDSVFYYLLLESYHKHQYLN